MDRPLFFHAIVHHGIVVAVILQIVDQPLLGHHFRGHGVLIAFIPLQQVVCPGQEPILPEDNFQRDGGKDREQHQHDNKGYTPLFCVAGQDHGFTTVR